MTELLRAAIDYRDRFGWSVIPVRGKKAACLWKQFQAERPTADQLVTMFSAKSVTGLATISGHVSGGLVIRDFDQQDAFDYWHSANPTVAAIAPTAKTARGFHVYGRCAVVESKHLDDGEIRSDGHYTLTPPSRHPDGCSYTWIIPPGDSIPEISLTAFLPLRDNTQANPSKPIALCPKILERVEKAIGDTLPLGKGQRNRKVFELARALRGFLPEAFDPNLLRIVVREWHTRALPTIETKAFDETWEDFCIAWPRVKRPKGSRFAEIIDKVMHDPLPAVALRHHGGTKMKRLIALCFALQEAHGQRSFPLAFRVIERELDVPRMKAWRMVQTLKAERVLQEVTVGRLKGTRASEYRLNQNVIPEGWGA